MHYDNASRAVAVRVGVFFGWASMRGPTSVSNAVGPVYRTETNRFFKIAEFALGPAYFKLVFFIYHGNAGRIVTAIFELAQAVKDQRHNLLITNVTNYSTHRFRMNDERRRTNLKCSPLFSSFLSPKTLLYNCRHSRDQRIRRYIPGND